MRNEVGTLLPGGGILRGRRSPPLSQRALQLYVEGESGSFLEILKVTPKIEVFKPFFILQKFDFVFSLAGRGERGLRQRGLPTVV